MNSENYIFDKKLIILFILKETKSALNIDQIAKFCLEFEDITYFDICLYLDELKHNGYIVESYEDNKSYYTVTESGLEILNELLELVPGINLLNMKNLLRVQIEDYKVDYEIDTNIIPIKSDEYKVGCYIKDGSDELINITIYAGDKENAKKISSHWKENANEIYGKIIELMTE
ncbi:MAG: DUF4364 family protein [Clostridia bacterium]|nr:DUF4364 family protein [Clostridia bacterium]